MTTSAPAAMVSSTICSASHRMSAERAAIRLSMVTVSAGASGGSAFEFKDWK